MKIKGLGGALVPAVLFACGGSSVGGSGSTGTGSGPLLSVTVTSGGTVTSADGSINCPGTCSQMETAGAAVHLGATPAAGMQFMGWSGACSGTGGCDLTMNGDATVGAAFAAQALVTVEVEVDGAGTGTVISTPAGIACPGTCLMQAAPGTVVALTSTADAGSRFDGYGGATCHGTSCNFTVSAAAKIFASFSSTVVTDSCTGLLPALPDQMMANGGVSGPGMECTTATSDGNGIVYVSAIAGGAGNVTATSPGNVQDTHAINDVDLIIPLQSGFAGMPHEEAGPNASVAYSPSGAIVSTTPFSADGSNGRGLNANGGSVVVSNGCHDGANTTFTFLRLDDQNQLTSSKTFLEATCPSLGDGVVPMIDLKNNLLLVYPVGGDPRGPSLGAFGIPEGRFAARWFDADANPLTDWFDAGAIAPRLPILLRPLIGGGAALRSGDNWVATLPSGTAMPAAPPAFFEADKDAVIALGGKAYAMIPDPGTNSTVDIVAASDGKNCGALASTKVNPLVGQSFTEFYVGKDGTLINTGGANNCSAAYYPHVLK